MPMRLKKVDSGITTLKHAAHFPGGENAPLGCYLRRENPGELHAQIQRGEKLLSSDSPASEYAFLSLFVRKTSIMIFSIAEHDLSGFHIIITTSH